MGLAVILVAAGRGERLGAGIPKAEVIVARKTLLWHSLSHVYDLAPDEVIVVAPSDRIPEFKHLCGAFHFDNLKIVAGGETRQDSVQNGLRQVVSENVLVHDSARAFMPSSVYRSVAKALDQSDCVVPVLPIADTVKEVKSSNVVKTLDRSKLAITQTPQGFKVATLRAALDSATENFTDEAGLLESIGVRVATVPGHAMGFKVTYPEDLESARKLLAEIRTGIGTDAHQFSDAGELNLGCLVWPELPKLEGHSDGDPIAHAMVDALLSAAGLGDIGLNFGVDRPEYQDAAGAVFLEGALGLLDQAGFEPVNVSVQVIGDRPKISHRREELETHLTHLIGAPVSIGATTTDGLGFLADSRGVAAVATALIRHRG
ncbi:MAG: 2-C-methyl-D-erythritol 4-phosphate cytidylyltransferase [Aquiluna sp.]|nr:2-C-methyl-D-erythritol 4-phosphate cytidylyltransferase [Aquiluna sp.]MCF8545430.1 2-C-methyl-D-erythritol 4-phosphate cytidylyltransferase [Aquiluna sp.]